jgi:NlpC/P60 family/MerC mercury resistance protein
MHSLFSRDARPSVRVDRFGAALSILCGTHCLATPLVLVALPAAARHSEIAEWLIVCASVVIGFVSVRASWRRTGSSRYRWAIIAALAAIVSSRLLLHGVAEMLLVACGSFMLITAHLASCRECASSCGSRVGERLSIGLLVILLAGCDSASAQSNDCRSDDPDLVAVAQRYIGTPYRFGASIKAVDCASYVQRVYRTFGVELPRTAARQFERGCVVLAGELVPGDLVFFRDTYRPGISHVGIYIGRLRFIHAARGGVRIASMASRYWSRRFAGGRRVVEPAVVLADVEGAGAP